MDKFILILGAGKSGEAVKKFCVSKKKAFLMLEDTRGKLFSGGQLEACSLAVLSPGIPSNDPVLKSIRAAGVPVVSELEFGAGFIKMPIVAITGTNGKTTTTALTGRLFSDAGFETVVCGNIGTPVSEAALIQKKAFRPEDKAVAVIEASSFQLEDTHSFCPHISMILNLAPDHLDRHGSMENYISAKTRIFANQTEKDFCLLNADDAAVAGLKAARVKKYFVSAKNQTDGAYLSNNSIYIGGIHIIESSELKLAGQHNVYNAMFSSLAAFLSGISAGSIADTLRNFDGVKHRLQAVRTVGQVTFYNDSKATNIDSCLTAVRAMNVPTALILGGSDKGYEFDGLFRGLTGQISRVFVCGATTDKIMRAAKNCGYDSIIAAGAFKDAVEAAYRYAAGLKMPAAVLLSPACASFDEFNNFEHRGDTFCALVNQIR